MINLSFFYVLSLLVQGLCQHAKKPSPQFEVTLQKTIQDDFNQSIYRVIPLKEGNAAAKENSDIIVEWFLDPKIINAFAEGIEATPINYEEEQTDLPIYIRAKKETDTKSAEILLHESIFSEGAKVVQNLVANPGLKNKTDEISTTEKKGLLKRLQEVDQDAPSRTKATTSERSSHFSHSTPSTEENADTTTDVNITGKLVPSKFKEQVEDNGASTYIHQTTEIIVNHSEVIEESSTDPSSYESPSRSYTDEIDLTTSSDTHLFSSVKSETTNAPSKNNYSQVSVSEVKKVPIYHKGDPFTLLYASLGCLGIIMIVVGGLAFFLWRKRHQFNSLEASPYDPQADNCDGAAITSHRQFKDV